MEVVAGRADLITEGTIHDEHQMRFSFPDFEELPHERGAVVVTPFVRCLGFTWQLMLYPGGGRKSSERERRLTIGLKCVGATTQVTQTPLMKYSIQVMDRLRSGAPCRFPVSGRTSDGRGFPNFIKRSHVLDPNKDNLVDGVFVVYVHVQIQKRKFWVPQSSLGESLVKLLEVPEDSDICFKVGGSDIRAHRCILRLRAPAILDMIGDPTERDIELPELDPVVFKTFLELVYGNDAPTPSQVKEFGLDLLKVADRFDCKRIKHAIESEIAECVLNADNAAEMLTVADSLSCPLLKEAAIGIFEGDQEAVMESEGWATVEESKDLLVELLRWKGRRRKSKRGTEDPRDDDIESMKVSMLRTKLEERGLDVDGTREMLVRRLKGEE